MKVLLLRQFLIKVPIISAVGHETDFSLSDYVADVRNSTPTAAAELVVQNYLQLQERSIILQHIKL